MSRYFLTAYWCKTILQCTARPIRQSPPTRNMTGRLSSCRRTATTASRSAIGISGCGTCRSAGSRLSPLKPKKGLGGPPRRFCFGDEYVEKNLQIFWTADCPLHLSCNDSGLSAHRPRRVALRIAARLEEAPRQNGAGFHDSRALCQRYPYRSVSRPGKSVPACQRSGKWMECDPLHASFSRSTAGIQCAAAELPYAHPRYLLRPVPLQPESDAGEAASSDIHHGQRGSGRTRLPLPLRSLISYSQGGPAGEIRTQDP